MRTSKQGKRLLAIVGLCGLSVLAVTGLCRSLLPEKEDPAVPASGPATPDSKPALKMPAQLFRNWPRPDLLLVLSAEQHGYLLPCGCSRPQTGGLERRYNFLQLLRAKGAPVVAVELGDIPQREGPRKLPNVQGLIKYRYAMESLRQMGYLAVGLGEHEAEMSLTTLLPEYALQFPSPAVLAANLHNKDELYPEQLKSYVVQASKGSRVKVGVAGLIGPSIGEKTKKHKVQLDDNRVVIPQLLNALAQQKTDLNVLLYQGTQKEAQSLAAIHKKFHVVLCLSQEDEPSSDPIRQENTLIAAVGHKGRYVGTVGVYATGKPERPFDYRYQLVSMSEDFQTPEGKEEGQPILALMERYTRELKREDYLARYHQVKHPSQVAIPGAVPTYVGSDKCKKCHETAYNVWEESNHAHAYDSLLKKAKAPSLRQFDGECIVCHTVGFGYESGYKNEKDTPHLKDVGCESCYGPAGEHVKNPRNAAWYPILNPWRPAQNETAAQKQQRQLRVDLFCQSCHDIDNDVKYKFEKRWPPVAHPSRGD